MSLLSLVEKACKARASDELVKAINEIKDDQEKEKALLYSFGFFELFECELPTDYAFILIDYFLLHNYIKQARKVIRKLKEQGVPLEDFSFTVENEEILQNLDKNALLLREYRCFLAGDFKRKDFDGIIRLNDFFDPPEVALNSIPEVRLGGISYT